MYESVEARSCWVSLRKDLIGPKSQLFLASLEGQKLQRTHEPLEPPLDSLVLAPEPQTCASALNYCSPSPSIFFFFFCFVFRERVSLYSPGYPGTHFVDQGGLKLRNLTASASQVVGLKACATMPGFLWLL